MRALCLLLFCLLACAPAASNAHTLSSAYLDVTVAADDGVRVQFDVSVRDLALTFPVDADRDDVVTWGELLAQRSRIEDWAAAGIGFSHAGNQACRLAPTGFGIRRYAEGAYVALDLQGRCATGPRAELAYGLLFERDPEHRVIVTLREGEGEVTTGILSQDRPRLPIGDRQQPVFLAYLEHGIHHILVGYDHLAFLLTLLLTIPLASRGPRPAPAPGMRKAFMQVLVIVTSFTLAHSITLTLAALDLVRPSSRWIEIAIAGSVLIASLNNLYPLVKQERLWAMGLVFGLIHGFGFAGALLELDLPEGSRLLALLSFNLGVEAGQIVIVLAVFPLLYAARNQSWYRSFVVPAISIAIALLASYWVAQRLAGG